ncbi:hypothetical protein FGB62_283g04 [Gracilaria domingensis]|nr:hypothetical protein FGB62_283g04 [Gracilaria domingensis]
MQKAVRPRFHFDNLRQCRSASSSGKVGVAHTVTLVQPKRTEDHSRSRLHDRHHSSQSERKKSSKQQPSSSSHGSKSAPAQKNSQHPQELHISSTDRHDSSRKGKGDRRSSSRRSDEADVKLDAEDVGGERKKRSSGKSRCHCKKSAKLGDARPVEGKDAERTGRCSSAARCKRSKP